MEVVYKESVFDKISKARVNAQLAGREIDYVILNANEVEQLKAELRMSLFPNDRLYTMPYGVLPESVRLAGVEIRSEPVQADGF